MVCAASHAPIESEAAPAGLHGLGDSFAISVMSYKTGDFVMPRKDLTKAIAYFRTSYDTNVGADKDTLKRQREAVSKYAAQRVTRSLLNTATMRAAFRSVAGRA
jgi:hypothetical protein